MVTDLKRGGAGKKVGGGVLRADDERFEFSDVREKKRSNLPEEVGENEDRSQDIELSKQF